MPRGESIDKKVVPSVQFVRRDRVEDMEELATRPGFSSVRIERIGKSQGADYIGIRVLNTNGQDMGTFYKRLDRINPVNQGPTRR